MNNIFNLNQQKIRLQKIRRHNKILRKKIRQQKIRQQQIKLRQIIYQILPLIQSRPLLLDDNTNNKIVNPKYNVKFYNNLNSNINSKKTIIHVIPDINGYGDYLRGSIFLAQCAKFFNINLELDVSPHNISNCIENQNKNEMRNINKHIYSFFYDNDNNYSDKFKLLLLINKFKKSKNTKLYIKTNLNYNSNIVTIDIQNYINSCLKFKQIYYDEVNKLFNLTNYNVLHIRCNDDYFDGDFNDQTLITKIIELRLNKNTIVMSNNYSLKQNLNKLFGFYFIDSKAVHTANTSNNLNDLYCTIIDYIILSKSSQTYCFSYYSHGSGFSEQNSVLNNVPYTVYYMNSNNIVNPDYVLLDYNINNNIHYNNISFITLTNDGYIDYTLNCIKSLNDIDIKQKLKVYCIGNNGYSILQQNNISCELIMDEKANKFQEFRTGNWSNVTYYKFQIIYENLLNNEYVCFTDGDIVYENKHIFLFLLNNIKDNDILIQDDNLDETLCSGFMFIKSNKNTISLFNPENVKKYINTVGWDDQIYINNIKHLIKYKKLPLYLFPTGAYYYNYNSVIVPYLIHFNWVVGHEKKNKMIYYKKWKSSNSIFNVCHHGTDGFGHQLEGHLRLLSLSINNKAKYINYNNKKYTFEHNNFNMYKLIQYFTESLNNLSRVTNNVTNNTTYNYNIILSENRTFDNILNEDYNKNILNNIYCYDGVSNKIGDTLPPNFETNNEIEKSLPILRDAFVKNNSYLPIQSYNNQFINVCCHIRLGDAIGQRILDTNNLFKVVKEFQKNNKYRVIIHTNGDVSELQHSNTIIYSVNTDVLQVLSDFIFADILIMNYSSLSIAAHLLADDRQKVICPTNAGNTFKHRILNKCITTEHFLNNHVYNNKIEI